MKLIHSLKCFLLEKKAIGSGAGLRGVVPLPIYGMADTKGSSGQLACAVSSGQYYHTEGGVGETIMVAFQALREADHGRAHHRSRSTS